MSHTKGKCRLVKGSMSIIGIDGKEIVSGAGFDIASRPKYERIANAKRIEKCWNQRDELMDKVYELIQEKDELISALRNLLVKGDFKSRVNAESILSKNPELFK